MLKDSLSLFATDKDLFDLLVAPRQRVTERVMLELARDRRIFCSSDATRHELADYLASLTHDFRDVAGLIEKGEPGTRNERTTFVTIDVDGVTEADVRSAIRGYQTIAGSSERVTMPPSGEGLVFANVEYAEFDYSRTHLLQRQPKNAALEFRVDDGKLKIRLPSTERAQEIVSAVISEIEREKRLTFKRNEIAISHLKPELRSKFFLYVMGKMEGYRADTAIRLKVASAAYDTDNLHDDLDEEAIENAADEMLHLVENVALSGENLLASPQYRQLAESGFFMTSITWRATQIDEPRDRVHFEVSFENGKSGTGFRYLARIASRSSRETYPQNFKLPSEARKKELFNTIEAAAHLALETLQNELAGEETREDD